MDQYINTFFMLLRYPYIRNKCIVTIGLLLIVIIIKTKNYIKANQKHKYQLTNMTCTDTQIYAMLQIICKMHIIDRYTKDHKSIFRSNGEYTQHFESDVADDMTYILCTCFDETHFRPSIQDCYQSHCDNDGMVTNEQLYQTIKEYVANELQQSNKT